MTAPHLVDESDLGAPSEAPSEPAWIAESQLLARAYRLAASAHASQRRATDGAPFLDHVVEVATFLHDAGFDEGLVTAGLLHDAVERGTLTEERLQQEMGDPVTSLVLSLTEDSAIESFAERKAALREQVRGRDLERSPSSPRTSSPTSTACAGGSTGSAMGSRSGWAPPSRVWRLTTASRWR